jgi:uncharacterized membrane protein
MRACALGKRGVHSKMAKSTSYLFHWQSALLLILFFLICLGLGYPTLNRYYPPQVIGTSDSGQYFNLVKAGPQGARGHWRYRVLVPYLAKPVYWLAKGHTRSWNPISFAILIINSAFVAISAYLLIILTLKIMGDYAIALLSALFYLLNYNISNLQLSGLVDSAEGCMILAVILALVVGRWALLLPLGIIGALAKETFVPLAGSLALIYWLLAEAPRDRRIIQLAWVISMGLGGLITVVTIQSVISGHLVFPWAIIASEKGSQNLFSSILSSLANKNLWFIFLWLLPLGLVKLRYLPRPLVYACAGSAAIALILGGWNNSGGNIGRPIFETFGPILTISLAYFIYSFKNISTQ